MQADCAVLGDEDGLDPREYFRNTSRKQGGRKTRQLCGQVADALNYAFAAVANDDVVRELCVLSVRPAPDESRLLVTVGPLLSGPCDAQQVLSHLHQSLGKLRSEVAASIHRKRVPQLTFCVAGPVEESSAVSGPIATA
jgi:ribosome-binding factor A